MKSFLLGLFMITTVHADWVDPQLEAWLSIKNEAAQLTTPRQNVIVYLKTPAFKDRTGLSKVQAVIEEKTFVRSFLRERSKEILSVLPLESQAADYLWSSNAFIVSVDRAGLNKLKKNKNIEGVVFNSVITLDDPKTLRGEKNSKSKMDESKMTYGLQVIHANAAWDQGITGEGVTIGVIDTGVDPEHPDLKGKILLQKDFTPENNNVDGEGHGTHVCGTIVGGNASGVSIGVAPGAKIIMAKALDSKGSGSLSGLLKAMEWMLDPDGDPSTNDAPRLVSNSWGASSQFIYGFRNVIRSWKRFNVLPNFAAGNSGPTPMSANSPGSYPFSFAVGAVDENLDITSFSSRGPVWWWKSWHPILSGKPDIAAPGLYVKSSVPGGHYETMSGTSMATPHMAGVAALAWQANPEISVDDMIQILQTTGLDRGKKGRDNKFGHGVVQVDQVLSKAKTWKINSPSFFQDKDPNQWEWATP